MERAVHVRDQPTTDKERAIWRNCNTAESTRAHALPAGHGWNGVPRQVGEVQDLPLDPPSAPVEGQGEEPRVMETKSLPLAKEALLVGKQLVPPPADKSAGYMAADGQPEEAVKRNVIRKARDEGG